jgi:hypothetical protein
MRFGDRACRLSPAYSASPAEEHGLHVSAFRITRGTTRYEGRREITMKLLLLALAIATAAAPKVAAASDLKAPLELTPKSALMAGVPHSSAPFVTAAQPELHLAATPTAPREQGRASCQSDHDLCYDASNGGHIVYKPARQFMPDLPGLKPENISIKRDRVIFKYSF